MTLRLLTANDETLLLTWRNDPETRRWSFTGKKILPDEHRAWLHSALASGDVRCYVGEVRGRPVGMVRFQRRTGESAEVSLVVAPEARGHRVGTELLRLGCAHVLSDPWGVKQIEARIKPNNLRSLSLFLRVGFHDQALVLVFP